MGCDLRIRVRYQRYIPTQIEGFFEQKLYCTECCFSRCEGCERADEEIGKYVSEWNRCPSSIPVSRNNKVLMYELESSVMSKEEVLEQVRKWAEMLSTTINDIKDSLFEDYSEAIVVLTKIYKEFEAGQFIEIDYS